MYLKLTFAIALLLQLHISLAHADPTALTPLPPPPDFQPAPGQDLQIGGPVIANGDGDQTNGNSGGAVIPAGLCDLGAYNGKFKSGDSVLLTLSAGQGVESLTDSKTNQTYPGTGTCIVSDDGNSATFSFTLDDDATYAFRGQIKFRPNRQGAILTANELKSGKVVDQLNLSL